MLASFIWTPSTALHVGKVEAIGVVAVVVVVVGVAVPVAGVVVVIDVVVIGVVTVGVVVVVGVAAIAFVVTTKGKMSSELNLTGSVNCLRMRW